jgi:hypothetical protein
MLVLVGLVACATTGKIGYYESRSQEHVYLGSRDVLMQQAARVISARSGGEVVRVDERTIQTDWALTNPEAVPANVFEAEARGQEPVAYQSYRATIQDLDARHHTVVIERGSVLGADPAGRTFGDRYHTVRAEHAKEESPGETIPVGTVTAPRGATAPLFARQPDLEWALLQEADPWGAASIESEKTVASGCSRVRAPKPPTPEIMQVARDCPDVPGLDDLVAARRLVLLGEMHGTEQAPEFVGTIACHAASEGFPILVALELPAQSNSQLQDFLESNGTAGDRRKYLESAGWQRNWHDGRSSAAMLQLVDRLRSLKRAGATIQVTGVDQPWTGDVRDSAMADAIEGLRRDHMDRPMFVLVGNLHAQTAPGKVTQSYVPIGTRLDRFGLRPVSLLMAFDAGTAWHCTMEGGFGCGVHAVRAWPPHATTVPAPTVGDKITSAYGMGAVGTAVPDAPKASRYVRLWPQRSEGFDGLFYVGPVSASRPAIEELQAGGPQPEPQRIQ